MIGAQNCLAVAKPEFQAGGELGSLEVYRQDLPLARQTEIQLL